MIFIVSPTFEDQREMHFFFFIELKNLAAMLSIIIQRSVTILFSATTILSAVFQPIK